MPPGIFLVALFGIAFALRTVNPRCAKALAGVAFIFYLLATPLVSDALLRQLEYRYEPPVEAAGDVIVMLGGGATGDAPDIGVNAGNLSGAASARLLTAARLQKALDAPVILAGGQVYSDTGREARIAKRILMDLGVEESKIFVEDQSLNTRQNAQNTSKILLEQGFKAPILVTSAFHMERSMINFAKENIDATPFPTDYETSRTYDFYFNKLAPSGGALANSCVFFRELLGILAAKAV